MLIPHNTQLGRSIWVYDNHVPAAGLILSITYGYNVRDCEDPFIAIADAATRNTVKAGGPGAMLCDMFPMRKFARDLMGIPREFFGTLIYLTSSSEVSKASTVVVPVCRVQTSCSVHKEACVEDV